MLDTVPRRYSTHSNLWALIISVLMLACFWLLLFLSSWCDAWLHRGQPWHSTAPPQFATRRLSPVTHGKDRGTGSSRKRVFQKSAKQILQELCQYLYIGKNPRYCWSESRQGELCIKLSDDLQYVHTVDQAYINDGKLTKAERRREEFLASYDFIQYLKESDVYGAVTNSWISKRLSRFNAPEKISRSKLIEKASRKICIVLVDVENVPDFKSNFIFEPDGAVRFLSPEPPPILVAPPLVGKSMLETSINLDTLRARINQHIRREGNSTTSTELQNLVNSSALLSSPVVSDYWLASAGLGSRGTGSTASSNAPSVPSNAVRSVYLAESTTDTAADTADSIAQSEIAAKKQTPDDDILVLTYAHTASEQAAWANRVTMDSRKNAADGEIIQITPFAIMPEAT